MEEKILRSRDKFLEEFMILPTDEIPQEHISESEIYIKDRDFFIESQTLVINSILRKLSKKYSVLIRKIGHTDKFYDIFDYAKIKIHIFNSISLIKRIRYDLFTETMQTYIDSYQTLTDIQIEEYFNQFNTILFFRNNFSSKFLGNMITEKINKEFTNEERNNNMIIYYISGDSHVRFIINNNNNIVLFDPSYREDSIHKYNAYLKLLGFDVETANIIKLNVQNDESGLYDIYCVFWCLHFLYFVYYLDYNIVDYQKFFQLYGDSQGKYIEEIRLFILKFIESEKLYYEKKYLKYKQKYLKLKLS